MEWSRGIELKVGLFVILSIVVAILVIFGIGSARQMFEDKYYFKTAFKSAKGLRVNTPVRVGGRRAGRVARIRFPDDLTSKKVIVTWWIGERYRNRIRQNSTARIGSKGVLGDKQLSVSVGTAPALLVEDWGWVPAGRATGVMDRAQAAVEVAEETLQQAQRVLRIFTEEGMVRDIQGTVRGLHELTEALNHGDGAANAILHDPQTKVNLDGALAGIAASSRELAGTSRELRLILHDARTQRGFLHALIYEQEGADAVASVGRASEELAALVHDVRTERGLLHSLIYTDEQANLLANLTETSAGVRQIVADLRAGRGTIGALLVDPSVYEDLKRVVGNIGRSRALRALVRYAITEDEQRPPPPRVRRPEEDGHPGENGR